MGQPTENEAECWIADLAERVPHVEPPYAALLAAGRLATRRRRRRRTVGAVLAVAAAVLAVLVVPQLFARDAHRRSAPTGPVSSAEPDVPAGMRLVGADGEAIAVPDSWTYGGYGRNVCTLAAHTYSFDTITRPRCRGHGAVRPLLTIELPLDIGAPAPLDPSHLRHVGGRTFEIRETCSGAVCSVSSRLDVGGVLFTVRVPSGRLATARSMAASVRKIGPGDSVLPPWQPGIPGRYDGDTASSYAETLSRAGLSFRLGLVGDPGAGIAPPTTPAVGEVVQRGTSVLVGREVFGTPRGMKYVVAGPAAIAVPSSWGRSATDGEHGHLHITTGVGDSLRLPGPGVEPTCPDGRCRVRWRLAGVMFDLTVPGPDRSSRLLIDRIGRTLVSSSALAPGASRRSAPIAAPVDPVPPGRRWVGRGGWQVDVPLSWSFFADRGCGRSPADVVVLANPVLDRTVRCPFEGHRGSPSLFIRPASAGEQRDDRQCSRTGCVLTRVAGTTAFEYTLARPRRGPDVVRNPVRIPAGFVAVPTWPDHDYDSSPQRGLFRPVPPTTYAAILRHAGLQPVPVAGTGQVTSPSVGSVVALGTASRCQV